MKNPKLISESELNRREKRSTIIIACVSGLLIIAWLYLLTTLFMNI